MLLVREELLTLGARQMASAIEDGNQAHPGAALMAAWWLCQDQSFGPDLCAAIERQADHLLGQNADLFKRGIPTPEQAVVLTDLLAHLREELDHVWAIGHDVPSLRLRCVPSQFSPNLRRHMSCLASGV